MKLAHLKIVQLLGATCLLFLCFAVKAQNFAVGDWQSHLPFVNVSSLTTDGTQLIAGTFGGILYFDPTDNSFERLSTVNGLSGVDVAKVHYNTYKNLLIIGYNDFGIDIYDGNSITAFSDIKNSGIQGQKRLNRIFSTDSLTYLCGTFGILATDITNKVVLENYSLTDGSTTVEAYDIAITDKYIFAATDKGIYQAEKNNPNLFNANEWTLHDMEQNILPGGVTHLITAESELYAIKDNNVLLFNGEEWNVYYSTEDVDKINGININENTLYLSIYAGDAGKVATIKNGELVNEFTFYAMQRPNDIVFLNESVYVGDLWNGLNKIVNNSIENYQPNGPRKQDNYALTFDANNMLWVAGGSAPGNFDATISYSDAGFYTYDNISWQNQNKYTLGIDQFVDLY